MKYRAALLGCGKIGSEFADDPQAAAWGVNTHAGAYAACSATELIAVCDTDLEKAKCCGRRWNVESHYVNPTKLLNEQRPDIVSVCTPDATHHELVRAALLTNGVKAVLAEKPLATSVEHGEELLQLARQRGVVLAVNYSRRYAANHIQLKKLLDEGTLGDLRIVRGLYTKGTAHNGTHWLDLARFLIGEVSAVQATDRLGEDGDDPTLDIQLKFAGGVVGELLGCSANEFTVFEMDILGSRGRIRILDSGTVIEHYEVINGKPMTGYSSLALKERTEGGMRDVLLNAVQDVVYCLQSGATPRCTGQDGLAALRIAAMARESALLNAA